MIHRQSFYQRHEGLILGGGAVIFVLAFWEYAWKQEWVSPLFFSGPSAIAKQFKYLLTEGTLLSDMAFSGKNFALGLKRLKLCVADQLTDIFDLDGLAAAAV